MPRNVKTCPRCGLMALEKLTALDEECFACGFAGETRAPDPEEADVELRARHAARMTGTSAPYQRRAK